MCHVQIKCISRLFAKDLNDFNIHLFGKTVYYFASILLLSIALCTNPSSNVPFGLLRSEKPLQFHVVLHLHCISDIS